MAIIRRRGKILILVLLAASGIAACNENQIIADLVSDADVGNGEISQKLVVAGRDCALGYSTNGGLNWSLAEQSGSCAEILEGIAFGQGIWMIAGSGETIMRSEDGENWTKLEGDFVSGDVCDFESVAYDDGLWVIGGEAGKLIYSQDNGDNWVDSGGGILAGNTLQGLAHDDAGRWVAVSDGGYVAYSDDPTDMLSWTAMQVTSVDFETVTWADGMWVAVGGSGMVFTSDDGAEWESEGAICGGNDIEDIFFDGSDQWFAIGIYGCLASSSSPMSGTWATSTLTEGEGGGGVVWVGEASRWVVAGIDGRIFYAEDIEGPWQRADDEVLVGEILLLLRGDV